KKQRYTLDDLMMQLREKDLADLTKVEFAVLETSGKLSVIEKEQQQNQQQSNPQTQLQKQQQAYQSALKQKHQKPDSVSSPKVRYEGLPLPLIMDGKVQDRNLEKIGKTRFWLKNELQAHDIYDFKDVFF